MGYGWIPPLPIEIQRFLECYLRQARIKNSTANLTFNYRSALMGPAAGVRSLFLEHWPRA